MYKLLFPIDQKTEKGAGVVSSLGTSFVAVCLYSTVVFSAGIPGRHHWLCLECVWCSLPVSLCAALAVVENPEPAGMWWGEAPLKIHAPEVPAGFLPGESIRKGLLCASVHSESQKNRSNFCSSRAVATPSCCNTHILKNHVFLKCCWVILQEGRGRVCSFGHQSVIPGF